ncbi:AT-hook motif nuclear-localized protein 17 [Cardamine amara subsp. amara]|uniref:AT-hook motif nuclear-localized protein n=1 Tax=Cardamine amara subsp. amara TaxID=228776 RepID=A0ABD1ALN3_CARAN
MLSKVPQQQHLHLSSFSAASMEVNRRPRGRPPGSKNKPRAPVLLTHHDSEPPMSPYILQVPSGNDIVETINRFCRRKGIGFCVLSGSGSVVNVTLRQPSPAAPGSTITFHGKFDLLSVSATFLPPPPRTSMSPLVSNFFTVSLAGPQGQIIGGFVAGPLISAGTVYVVAASINNPSYHRLPAAEEEQRSAAEGEEQSPPVSGGGGESGHVATGSGGESMYSCHMGGSDVIWAPTARAPPPY